MIGTPCFTRCPIADSIGIVNFVYVDDSIIISEHDYVIFRPGLDCRLDVNDV